MTFWILLWVCINGAQGCTYSKESSVKLIYDGSYSSRDECRKDAARINERYDDSRLYGECIEIKAPPQQPK